MNRQELQERTRVLRKKIEMASASLSDARALKCVSLFPKWEPDVDVIFRERIQYDGILYRALVAHTTTIGQEPDTATDKWERVVVGEYPEWDMPHGRADSYMNGDKVGYKEVHYVSTKDYNTDAPYDSPESWTEV